MSARRARPRRSFAWLDFLGLGVLLALLPYPAFFFGGLALVWALRSRCGRAPPRRRYVRIPARA